jgi:hypothetical protein
MSRIVTVVLSTVQYNSSSSGNRHIFNGITNSFRIRLLSDFMKIVTNRIYILPKAQVLFPKNNRYSARVHFYLQFIKFSSI